MDNGLEFAINTKPSLFIFTMISFYFSGELRVKTLTNFHNFDRVINIGILVRDIQEDYPCSSGFKLVQQKIKIKRV